MSLEFRLKHDALFLLITVKENEVTIDDGDGGELTIETNSVDDGKREAACFIDALIAQREQITAELEQLKAKVLK